VRWPAAGPAGPGWRALRIDAIPAEVITYWVNG